MNKFGFAAIAATGFAAALFGFAAPAQAAVTPAPAAVTTIEAPTGVDHHAWINDIQQQVTTPPTARVGNGR